MEKEHKYKDKKDYKYKDKDKNAEKITETITTFHNFRVNKLGHCVAGDILLDGTICRPKNAS